MRLANGKFDRTEVDLRLGNLLVEAKLTEGNFGVNILGESIGGGETA